MTESGKIKENVTSFRVPADQCALENVASRALELKALGWAAVRPGTGKHLGSSWDAGLCGKCRRRVLDMLRDQHFPHGKPKMDSLSLPHFK